MDSYQQVNREHWDELVAFHAESEFYMLAEFKAGQSSLLPVEVEELGDVSGKSLLHLQCHFGMDTLSWARRGARVTGVDFSDKAIALARSLSHELGLPAEFICSNIYDVPQVLSQEFDIVFTSYGVLCWLPDLKRWGEIISYFQSPAPSRWDDDGSYAAWDVHLQHRVSYEWQHGLGEVVNALTSAGLNIE